MSSVSPRSMLPVFARVLAVAALGLASCAAQTILHEQRGPDGTVIVSQDASGLRTLRFAHGGARQSVVKPGDPAHLELAYAKAALVGLSLAEKPGRMLVIGLGGGSLPMYLRHYYPEAQIDAVDISAQVVDVAKRYFGFREDARMRAHVMDGRRFIEAARPGSYDLVILDAFGAASVPAPLTTREFLLAVRRALDPRGVVVGNVWGRGFNVLYDDMLRTYQEVFDELYVVSAGAEVNNLLLALPRSERLTQAGLAARAQSVALARGFRYDLGAIVQASFLHANERLPASRVLRD